MWDEMKYLFLHTRGGLREGFWREGANGRWAKREKELPTAYLHMHMTTAHACLAKKVFAVWIWILAVQMSLAPFWQVSTVQGIGQATIFFSCGFYYLI